MDPATLAITVVSALSPYLTAGATKAAEKLGEKSVEVLGQLWNTLTGRLAKDPEAAGVLQSYKARPERYQDAVRQVLTEHFELDPAFCAEALRLVREGGPGIFVNQRIEELRGEAVGVDMDRSDPDGVRVEQDVTTVTEHGSLTGVRVKRS
jgi:hypothetical protein